MSDTERFAAPVTCERCGGKFEPDLNRFHRLERWMKIYCSIECADAAWDAEDYESSTTGGVQYTPPCSDRKESVKKDEAQAVQPAVVGDTESHRPEVAGLPRIPDGTISKDRPNVVWCNGTAVDEEKNGERGENGGKYYVCPTMNENCQLQKERDDAQSNLASICDVLNSWAREAGFRENDDYLGFMKIRDHVNELWGHVNGRQMKAVEKSTDAVKVYLDALDEVRHARNEANDTARLEREMSIRWKEKKDAAERRADRMAAALSSALIFIRELWRASESTKADLQPDAQKVIAEIEGALKEWD